MGGLFRPPHQHYEPCDVSARSYVRSSKEKETFGQKPCEGSAFCLRMCDSQAWASRSPRFTSNDRITTHLTHAPFSSCPVVKMRIQSLCTGSKTLNQRRPLRCRWT